MAVENVIRTDMSALPENCIANVLSLTTPKDACCLSLVASNFRSAAESDTVWKRFLPPNYRDLTSPAFAFTSKKNLYFHLCDHHIITKDGTKSFLMEKGSGKISYMLSARSLEIDTRYWQWVTIYESRFPEAPELLSVCRLEIHGKISTKMLSPRTNYAAYFVFTVRSDLKGFKHHPVDTSVRIGKQEAATRTFYLYPKGIRLCPRLGLRVDHRRVGLLGYRTEANVENNGEYPKLRDDGWMEIEMGEVFIRGGVEEDDCVDISLKEVKERHWKSGIMVLGIEIRPK